MIQFLFFVGLSLVLIIAQTSVMPGCSFFFQSFDLLIVNVLYLALLFSNPFILIGVVFLGTIMDSLSGVPFGVYISVYLWIFISVQGLKRFVHPGSFVFLPIISAAAVLLENFFLIFSFFVRNGSSSVSSQDFAFMLKQTVWAFFLVPLLIGAIHVCQKGVVGFVEKTVRRLTRPE
ncbi:MAG TPA: hypothetical protein VJ936_01825 [Desulfobacteraceae bacterium]|nr:hypothetical protein [Desulfobacteraceae bacterium]